MKKDEVIRMAREAGLRLDKHNGGFVDQSELLRFAALVAAAEREACAKVCDERKHYWQRDDIRRHEDEHCAAAIHARSNT